MVLHSRPLQLAALTAFLSLGMFAGPASAETVSDRESAAVAEIAVAPEQAANESAAVSLGESNSLALTAFPIALLAVAAGTVVAANTRRES